MEGDVRGLSVNIIIPAMKMIIEIMARKADASSHQSFLYRARIERRKRVTRMAITEPTQPMTFGVGNYQDLLGYLDTNAGNVPRV